MALPETLARMAEIWRGRVAIGPGPRVCRLRCYRPVVQCQTYWCWAAILQELLARRDPLPPPTQCQIVAHSQPPAPCACTGDGHDCRPHVPHPCNVTGLLDQRLPSPIPGRKPFRFRRVSDPSRITPPLLCRWLDLDRVVIAFFDGGGDHHYAVVSALADHLVRGYQLEITDPDRGQIYTIPWYPGYAILNRARNAAVTHALVLP